MTAVDRTGRATRWGLSHRAKSWTLAAVWVTASSATPVLPPGLPVARVALFAVAAFATLLLFIAVPRLAAVAEESRYLAEPQGGSK
jgi:hypothetical protein